MIAHRDMPDAKTGHDRRDRIMMSREPVNRRRHPSSFIPQSTFCIEGHWL
jgi:hypothetical protein